LTALRRVIGCVSRNVAQDIVAIGIYAQVPRCVPKTDGFEVAKYVSDIRRVRRARSTHGVSDTSHVAGDVAAGQRLIGHSSMMASTRCGHT
jgi:hypothetical protein